MEREVRLEDVLDARERRAARQQDMLSRYGLPLVSFTMNIPGPVKDTALIRRGFRRGEAALENALREENISVPERIEILEFTGCELLLCADAPPEKIKALCVAIEESCPLGRLFDMDVLTPDGKKLDRETERRCVVCGAPGRGCASRRVHAAPELRKAVDTILQNHFAAEDGETVARLATQALTDEVDATPKPGLVDRRNTGSHRDMNRDTFLASAEALRSYWSECFALGREYAGKDPGEAFLPLRAAGLRAEQAMLSATGGVNTHKGVIFTLGTVCGAVGRLWSPEKPFASTEEIAAECARLFAPVLERDLAAATGRTAGERLYMKNGTTGARGELAAGLPGVTEIALPALRETEKAGGDYNSACVYALLRLIARGTDTNMLHRGGELAAEKAAEAAKALADAGPVPDRRAAEALDDAFIRENLSPGGCADLLATALFFKRLEQENTK